MLKNVVIFRKSGIPLYDKEFINPIKNISLVQALILAQIEKGQHILNKRYVQHIQFQQFRITFSISSEGGLICALFHSNDLGHEFCEILSRQILKQFVALFSNSDTLQGVSQRPKSRSQQHSSRESTPESGRRPNKYLGGTTRHQKSYPSNIIVPLSKLSPSKIASTGQLRSLVDNDDLRKSTESMPSLSTTTTNHHHDKDYDDDYENQELVPEKLKVKATSLDDDSFHMSPIEIQTDSAIVLGLSHDSLSARMRQQSSHGNQLEIDFQEDYIPSPSFRSQQEFHNEMRSRANSTSSTVSYSQAAQHFNRWSLSEDEKRLFSTKLQECLLGMIDPILDRLRNHRGVLEARMINDFDEVASYNEIQSAGSAMMQHLMDSAPAMRLESIEQTTHLIPIASTCLICLSSQRINQDFINQKIDETVSWLRQVFQLVRAHTMHARASNAW
mmetsp:Transcript_10809/g.15830  ORF Transcript_10809/g.15830 Transcript_10809/m.15830 type:complete len:445 (+) Transcript_10809:53-1387(+)